MLRLVALLALLVLASPLRAQSTTFLLIPTGHFPTVGGTAAFGTDDVLRCVDWIEDIGITNATKLVAEVVSSSVGTAASVTIYTAGGASIVTSTGAQSWTSTGVKPVTSLTVSPISLTGGGTEYRLCWCRDGATTGTLRAATNATLSLIGDWYSALANNMGEAANACSTGVPPSSTGALTPVDMQIPLIMLSLE